MVEEIIEMNYNNRIIKIFLCTDGENGGRYEVKYMQEMELKLSSSASSINEFAENIKENQPEHSSYVCSDGQMLLYAVTDSKWASKDYTLEMQIEDVLKGGVTLLQLREKGMETKELAELGKRVKAICEKYNVPMLIDDDVEAAYLCGADGVHVGQGDMSPTEVRKILGDSAIVGVTAKTVEQALKAQNEGASYIGTGAAFPTGTKKDTYVISHDTIRDICDSLDIPVVAIGGIDYENVEQLKGTHINGVAVVSAIFAQKDIRSETERLKQRVIEVIQSSK